MKEDDMYPDHMWFGGGWMMFPWLFFLTLFVLAFLWRSRSSSGSSGDDPGTALEILKKRYAKGEITRDEFEKMKQDIS